MTSVIISSAKLVFNRNKRLLLSKSVDYPLLDLLVLHYNPLLVMIRNMLP